MIATLIILGALLLLALVLFTVLMSLRQAAYAGGLNALCVTYPAAHMPAGEVRARQRVMVEAIRFRNCVLTVVSHEGFFVGVRFGGRPVLIPWSQFRSASPVTAYWRRMVRLSVGLPEIATMAVETPLYELMRPFLPSQAQLPV